MGFSLVEMLIITLLSGLVIAYVSLILSKFFIGEKRGFDSLSLLQEEGKFLSYLKHDLRTIIIGGDDNIPPPAIQFDGARANTCIFSFFKVDTADEFGRPVWVSVQYELEKGSQAQFTMYRTAGTKGIRMRMLQNMITRFSVQLFDQNNPNPLPEARFNEAKKIKIFLGTLGGQRLQVTANFYSPFLPSANSSIPAPPWLSNYHYQVFDPKTGSYVYSTTGKILEYDGTPITSKEDLIKGAEGIGLTGETNKIWGHK